MEFTAYDICTHGTGARSLSDTELITAFTTFVHNFLQAIENKKYLEKGILFLEKQEEERVEEMGIIGMRTPHLIFNKGNEEEMNIFINDSINPFTVFLVSMPDELGELFQKEIEGIDWKNFLAH